MLYPLKRVGRKGEARFEQVSWDEALDDVATRLRAIVAEGVHFITMELVRGRTLADLISGDRLDLPSMRGRMLELCDAVAAAHDRGIIHRDLKPANVMIGEDGRLKVLDFGLAKIVSRPEDVAPADPTQTSTQAGVILGTLSYMSPEQARGEPIDQRRGHPMAGSAIPRGTA